MKKQMKKIFNLLWIACISSLIASGCGDDSKSLSENINAINNLINESDNTEESKSLNETENTDITDEDDIIQKKNDDIENMSENENADTAVTDVPDDEEKENDTTSDSIRPEFKEAMDSYEAFMDEYIAFMENYSNSTDIMSLLTDYTDYMTKYAEFTQKIAALDADDLSPAEAAYYAEVTARVSQKLLKVGL